MAWDRKKVEERNFRSVLKALRHECPTAMGFPVRVRRCNKPSRLFGWAYFSEAAEEFRIVLCTHVFERVGKGKLRPRPVTFAELRETLIHEWAHCMAWRPDHPSVEDHDPVWGIMYSQCYQTTIED